MPFSASTSGHWQASGTDIQAKHYGDGHDDAVFLSPLPKGGASHARKHNTVNNNNNHIDFLDSNTGGGDAGGGGTAAAAATHDEDHAHQKRHLFQSVFSATNTFLWDGQDNGPTPSPAHLAPPSHYTAEMSRARNSTSSLDSYNANSRRRGSYRGGSASRLSDVLDEESGDAATLMTYMRGIGHALKLTRRLLKRALQLVFVARTNKPRLVCEADVMEQAGWVCKDYIVARLVARDLMSRKTGITPSNWPHSRHVIAAGSALEALYPRTYSNVSRKLCLTMSSPKVVRNTLTAILEVLFEKTITWAKIVSMMAIAGLYAEECASQGHSDFVREVVDVVLDFTGGHLLAWLVSQGGWDSFPLPEGSESNRLSKFRLFVVTGAVTTAVLARYYYLLNYSSHRPD